MLPKLHRLNEKKDFQIVLKKGKMLQGQYFGLSFLPSQTETKIGIIVSNKISKSAVERNRIRRIVRSTALDFINKNKTGFKLVFLAKKPSENADSEKIKQDIENLFEKHAKISN